MSKIDNFGDKRGIADFSKHPENINKHGRPPSIDKQIKEYMSKVGDIVIPAKLVKEVKENGDVIIEGDWKKKITLKLLEYADSKKGYESLKAIQMIIERVDGRPLQKIDANVNQKTGLTIHVETEQQKQDHDDVLKMIE
jgi:hypothetical protein